MPGTELYANLACSRKFSLECGPVSLTKNENRLVSRNDKDLARLIVDKISSLTDRNALEIHKNYFKSNYTL